MFKPNFYALFGILFLSSVLLVSGMYSSTNQILAQHENEAEINADIEQENKCKKDTECENKNEINNQLTITNITQAHGTESSLTIKKEVIGCNDISVNTMDCTTLPNNDPAWLPCTDSTISNNQFCQRLPENLFDIEILDNQNTQLEQFVGSAKGTTLSNLEPGTYTVNEIKYPGIPVDNQLTEGPIQQCIAQAFPDSGYMVNRLLSPTILYDICIEYEDEQGNDCSIVTLAVGEEKICTVKNYIQYANIGR